MRTSSRGQWRKNRAKLTESCLSPSRNFASQAGANCTLASIQHQCAPPRGRPSRLSHARRLRCQLPAECARPGAIPGRYGPRSRRVRALQFGKSSAINALVARRGLARTSKTPGRTQLINFFQVGAHRRLVDLPGYGYAKVPDAVRRRWRYLLEAYFVQRRSLVGLMVTVDIRRSLNELDWVMLNWAQGAQVPATVLLTKTDKLSRGAARTRHLEFVGACPRRCRQCCFRRLRGWA